MPVTKDKRRFREALEERRRKREAVRPEQKAQVEKPDTAAAIEPSYDPFAAMAQAEQMQAQVAEQVETDQLQQQAQAAGGPEFPGDLTTRDEDFPLPATLPPQALEILETARLESEGMNEQTEALVELAQQGQPTLGEQIDQRRPQDVILDAKQMKLMERAGEVKEAPDGLVANWMNEIRRGWLIRDQGKLFLQLISGRGRDEAIDDWMEVLKEMSEIPIGKDMRAFHENDSFFGSIAEIIKNPIDIGAMQLTQSFTSLAPEMGAGAAAIAGGAKMGAATGGPVGATVGAGVGRGVAGFTVGQASWAIESAGDFSEAIMDRLAKDGKDPFSAANWKQLMKDEPEWIESALNQAKLQNLPIGILDAASIGGIGLITKALGTKTLARKFIAGAAETAFQMGAGGGGEMAKQAIKGEGKASEVAMEVALEAPIIGGVGAGVGIAMNAQKYAAIRKELGLETKEISTEEVTQVAGEQLRIEAEETLRAQVEAPEEALDIMRETRGLEVGVGVEPTVDIEETIVPDTPPIVPYPGKVPPKPEVEAPPVVEPPVPDAPPEEPPLAPDTSLVRAYDTLRHAETPEEFREKAKQLGWTISTEHPHTLTTGEGAINFNVRTPAGVQVLFGDFGAGRENKVIPRYVVVQGKGTTTGRKTTPPSKIDLEPFIEKGRKVTNETLAKRMQAAIQKKDGTEAAEAFWKGFQEGPPQPTREVPAKAADIVTVEGARVSELTLASRAVWLKQHEAAGSKPFRDPRNALELARAYDSIGQLNDSKRQKILARVEAGKAQIPESLYREIKNDPLLALRRDEVDVRPAGRRSKGRGGVRPGVSGKEQEGAGPGSVRGPVGGQAGVGGVAGGVSETGERVGPGEGRVPPGGHDVPGGAEPTQVGGTPPVHGADTEGTREPGAVGERAETGEGPREERRPSGPGSDAGRPSRRVGKRTGGRKLEDASGTKSDEQKTARARKIEEMRKRLERGKGSQKPDTPDALPESPFFGMADAPASPEDEIIDIGVDLGGDIANDLIEVDGRAEFNDWVQAMAETVGPDVAPYLKDIYVLLSLQADNQNLYTDITEVQDLDQIDIDEMVRPSDEEIIEEMDDVSKMRLDALDPFLVAKQRTILTAWARGEISAESAVAEMVKPFIGRDTEAQRDEVRFFVEELPDGTRHFVIAELDFDQIVADSHVAAVQAAGQQLLDTLDAIDKSIPLADEVDAPPLPKKIEPKVDVDGNDLQVPTVPRSGVRAEGTLTPRSQAEFTQQALDRLESERGDIDDFVSEELGYPVKAEEEAREVDDEILAVYQQKVRDYELARTVLDRELELLRYMRTDRGRRIPAMRRQTIKEGKKVFERRQSVHIHQLEEAVKKARAAVRAAKLAVEEAGTHLVRSYVLGQYFHAEQVDAIGLALHNLKKGLGFINGDQTGLGKGRFVAAMLRWAKRQGALPVFVTQKPNLYLDMMRDLVAIDTAEFWPIVTNNSLKALELPDGRKLLGLADQSSQVQQAVDAFEKDGVLKVGNQVFDGIFTTYSQMQQQAGADTGRMDVLRQIASSAIFVLDESHEAGGGKQATSPDKTPRSQFVRALLRESRGTIYSSATFAKRSNVMDLYFRTDLRKAVDDLDDLVKVVRRGGLPMQQIISTMLAEAGQYVRREKTFDGVEFTTSEVDVGIERADTIGDASNRILRTDDIARAGMLQIQASLNKQVQEEGNSDKERYEVHPVLPFNNYLHLIAQHALLAAKSDAVVEAAQASLDRGEKPFLTFSFTNESFLEKMIAFMKPKKGEGLDVNYQDVFRQYIRNTRRYKIIKKVKRGTKWVTKNVERLTLDGATIDEAAESVNQPSVGDAFETSVAETDELVQSMDDLADLPASPIDYVKWKLGKHKFKDPRTGEIRTPRIGEITGRSITLQYSDDAVPQIKMRDSFEKTPAGKVATVAAYNGQEGISEPLDVLVGNRSASTGLSAHARAQDGPIKFTDLRRRFMIIAQAEQNIDEQMQMLGRINRVGQLQDVLPGYMFLMANLPIEQRPAAVLMKKMSSLNANVLASAKSGVSFDIPDFMNEVGNDVVKEMFEEDPTLQTRLHMTERPQAHEMAHKVTNRIIYLSSEEQEDFFVELFDRYASRIEFLDSINQNPLSAKDFNLDAKTMTRDQIFEGDPNDDSPFARPSFIEEIDMKRIGKSYTGDQVKGLIDAYSEEALSGEVDWVDLSNVKGDPKKSMIPAGIHLAISDATQSYLRSKMDAMTEKGVPLEEQSRIANQINREMNTLITYINTYRVGTQVKITDNATKDLYWGIITSVKPRKNWKTNGNPSALSRWRVKVAVISPEREIPFSFRQLFSLGEDEPAMFMDKVPVTEIVWAETNNEWEAFDIASSESKAREARYMATGNLPAAVGKGLPKGTIMTYTTEGHVREIDEQYEEWLMASKRIDEPAARATYLQEKTDMGFRLETFSEWFERATGHRTSHHKVTQKDLRHAKSEWDKLSDVQKMMIQYVPGRRRQGILLPRLFQIKDFLDKLPVRFKSAEHVMRFLDAPRTTLLQTGDEKFMIQKVGLRYRVMVKGKGGVKYYRNARLVELIRDGGGELKLRTTKNWSTDPDMTREGMERLVKFMLAEGRAFYDFDKNTKDLAAEITGQNRTPVISPVEETFSDKLASPLPYSKPESDGLGNPTSGWAPTTGRTNKPRAWREGTFDPSQRAAPWADFKKLMEKIGGARIHVGLGSFKKMHAAGWYRRDYHEIRMRTAEALETALHEMGHAMHKRFLNMEIDFPPSVVAELTFRGRELYKETSPTGGYAREGFAEFFSRWMLGERPQDIAPKFYIWLHNEVFSRHPQLFIDLRKLRRMTEQYDRAGALQRIIAKVHRQPSGAARVKEGFLSRLGDQLVTRTLFNDAAPLERKVWETMAVQGKTLDDILPDMNPALVRAAYKMSAKGISLHFITKGAITVTGEPVGPSLSELLKELETSQEEEAFMAYLYAHRSYNMMKGIGRSVPIEDTGISLRDAESVINYYRDNEKFARLAKGVTQWSNRLMEFVADQGGLGRTTLEVIKKANPIYAPFRRYFDRTYKRVHGRSNVGAGGVVDQPHPLPRIRGSSRTVVNMFEAFAMNAEELITKAQKIAVGKSLIKFAEANKGVFEKGTVNFMWPVDLPKQRITTTVGRLRSQLEDMGVNLDTVDMNEMIHLFIDPKRYGGPENVVMIWRTKTKTVKNRQTGKEEIVHVEEPTAWEVTPEIYNVITDFDAKMVKALAANGMWDLFVSGPTRLVRAGATAFNPRFGLANILRDAWSLMAYTKAGIDPDKSFGKQVAAGVTSFSGVPLMPGLAQIIRTFAGGISGGRWLQDRATNLYSALGGPFETFLGQDQRKIERLLRRARLKHTKYGPTSYVVDPRNWLDVFREAMSSLEQAPRTVEFRAVLNQMEKKYGKGSLRAAIAAKHASKDVTVDFTRFGIVGGVLNTALPFFNARLQGMSKFHRTFLWPLYATFKPGRKPTKTEYAHLTAASLRSFAWMTIPTLMYWSLIRDEEWYKELPLWRRLGFWNFRVGNNTISIPRPFELGWVFSSMPEAIADYIYHEGSDQDKRHLNAAIAETFQSFSPISSVSGILPANIRPAWEVYSNKNWRGRPIRDKFDNRVLRDQYRDYTTTTSKAIANKIYDFGQPAREATGDMPWVNAAFDVSPTSIDHYIGGYTGGMGLSILRMIEWAGGFKPPASEYRDPISSYFFPELATGHRSAPVMEFYERYELLRSRDESDILEDQDKTEFRRIKRAQKYISRINSLRRRNRVEAAQANKLIMEAAKYGNGARDRLPRIREYGGQESENE